jgi:glycosyltransferase involved in cell wall biosynthesis
MKQPKIVITIPAYNEERSIGKVIKAIKRAMQEGDYRNYKILVLNDGSKDNTVKIATKLGAIVVSNKRNSGLAITFKREMEECLKLNSDIIVHTDADGQYPARYIPKLIKKLEKGYDLVLGSRFSQGKYSGSMMKRIGNIAFAKVFSGLLRSKITDTTTGFRAFTNDVAELELINTFTYTQEQLIRAGKAKMKVGEIPITTYKTRPSRLFKGSLDYAIRAWINIFRIYRDFEPLYFFGRIGLIFVSIGLVLGFYILYFLMRHGHVGGIPRVILSMLLIMIGVQIIVFGFLADMQKK